MKTLSIINQTIRQQGNLYSLNDLHQASGGEAKHRPNYFLENDQTKALIEEISNAGNPAFETRKGNNGGTFACKELVIAYAAWISAAFHLKVIGVFLDSVQHPQSLPPSKQITEAAKVFTASFRLMRLIGLDKNAAALSANQSTRKLIGLNLLELGGQTHLKAENQDSGYYTPTQLGQHIGGLSAQKVNRLLETAGLQARACDEWNATTAGEPYSRRFDTARKHSNGRPVTQLMWALSAIPFIQPVQQQGAAQ